MSSSSVPPSSVESLLADSALDLADVANLADGVEVSLSDGQLGSEDTWAGVAASAYRAEVDSQRDAAGELGSIAESMKSSLLDAASSDKFPNGVSPAASAG